MNSRLIKIFFSCSVGLYISLVCFNNITDYKSNFQFVSVISQMTDIFSKERNGWRSVNSVALHHVFYIIIIGWELSIAVLMWLGTFRMISKFRTGAMGFKNAKKYTTLGLSLGVLLFFTVFIAIAGEWFLMWQSKNWNEQSTAFFLTCCLLLFLIHHNQEDI
jgi:predicted small integral membrane protein